MDILKGVLLSVIVISSTPLKIESIEIPQEANFKMEMTIEEKVKHYALKWGQDVSLFKSVIKCESGFNPNAVNWSDSHALSQGSHGIAQFSKETFLDYAKKMGREDYSDPYNPDEALDVMGYMWSIGQEHHWSCWKKQKAL